MTGRLFEENVLAYVESLRVAGGYAYMAGGGFSVYGTAYASLIRHYFGETIDVEDGAKAVLDRQDPETGYFFESCFDDWSPPVGAMHDREHLLLHTTCAVLPFLQEIGVKPRHPLKFAEQFRGSALGKWLKERDMTNPWLEGNNLLFAGQVLLYLHEIEGDEGAREDLEFLFSWLDDEVDPATGLWGTNHGAGPDHAIYGGYHQLLLYYYKERKLHKPKAVIDICLSLQTLDGGYAQAGDAGACEDVDTVDVLVNYSKRFDLRRPEVVWSLRRCLTHILELQNKDGGFPYNRNRPFTHNGMKGTEADPGQSTVFATWFRVHTLALMAELLPEAAELFPQGHGFSSACSMGWHDPGTAGFEPLPVSRLTETSMISRQCMRKASLLLDQKWRRAKGRLRRLIGMTGPAST
ncbi:MAG: hypothetical protein AAGA58_18130 [Verrucomicrobiota bacterium]